MASQGLSHRARLEKTLAGEALDRPAVALWRHFPVDDQDPISLAAAHLDYQRQFDFDLIKVTPASSFFVKDWGAQDVWLGDTEGTRRYTGKVIRKPEDWQLLRVLDPYQGYLGRQLDCLQSLVSASGDETPIIQTIFNPLSVAKYLLGKDGLAVHLRSHPEAFHAGLQTITESIARFIEAASKIGISGVFFAVQHAQVELLSPTEYELFGRSYDLMALEPARFLWLNMLHLHGANIMFDKFMDYPVTVINWHDRETPPTLADGQRQFNGVVCGGLRREETMVLGSPEQVRMEAFEALEMTAGKKIILGTGCVVPITAPRANLVAARQAVEAWQGAA